MKNKKKDKRYALTKYQNMGHIHLFMVYDKLCSLDVPIH